MSVVTSSDFVKIDWPAVQMDLCAENDAKLRKLEEHYTELYEFAKVEVEGICARTLGKIALTDAVAGELLSCCYRLNEIDQGYEKIKTRVEALCAQVRDVSSSKSGAVQMLARQIENIYSVLRGRNISLKQKVAPPKTYYHTLMWGYDPAAFEQFCLQHFIK